MVTKKKNIKKKPTLATKWNWDKHQLPKAWDYFVDKWLCEHKPWAKEVKTKTISPNNPNQTENQWGRPPIWIDKWTDEVVIEELENMYTVLIKDKGIIFIWELFETKPYARSSFIQQVTKRKNNIKIKQVYNTIKEILENRAIKWAMKNELNATSTIFHLKNNYKWVDKHEVDNNIKWELSINDLKSVSTEELLKEKKSNEQTTSN